MRVVYRTLLFVLFAKLKALTRTHLACRRKAIARSLCEHCRQIVNSIALRLRLSITGAIAVPPESQRDGARMPLRGARARFRRARTPPSPAHPLRGRPASLRRWAPSRPAGGGGTRVRPA